jgi:hypothetical protein
MQAREQTRTSAASSELRKDVPAAGTGSYGTKHLAPADLSCWHTCAASSRDVNPPI